MTFHQSSLLQLIGFVLFLFLGPLDSIGQEPPISEVLKDNDLTTDSIKEFEDAILGLIVEGEYQQASDSIIQLRRDGITEQQVQQLRMQLFLGLRKQIPDGFDIEKEVDQFLSDVKDSVDADSTKLGSLISVMVFVGPVLSKYDGDVRALKLFDETIEYIDQNKHEPLGSPFYSILLSAHRSRFEVMKRMGKSATAIAEMQALLNRIESFSQQNPDDDSARLAQVP